MADTRGISQWLQDELARRRRSEVTPNEAAEWLDAAGLLRAGGTARGLPLRNLLRAGEIEGSEQLGRQWTIKRIPESQFDEGLCRGWSEAQLREVIQLATPLRREILRAIAELPEPTMADVAARLGVSERTVPANLTHAFKAVQPPVSDNDGVSWPMHFGRRGPFETYQMPEAVSEVVLRELDRFDPPPETAPVASLEDALRARGFDDRTIQEGFDFSNAAAGTIAAIAPVHADDPVSLVERLEKYGRPYDRFTYDNNTRSVRLERPLPNTSDQAADVAIAMHEEIGRASLSLARGREDVVEDAIRTRRPPTASAADRRAIEQRAVLLAEQHFEADGWTVRDVGSSRAYDLYLTKGDGSECFVEVKGTTGNGATVVLTANEVSVANERWPHTALAIVTDVVLGAGDPRVATGGTLTIESPWQPVPERLSALAYSYDRR